MNERDKVIAALFTACFAYLIVALAVVVSNSGLSSNQGNLLLDFFYGPLLVAVGIVLLVLFAMMIHRLATSRYSLPTKLTWFVLFFLFSVFSAAAFFAFDVFLGKAVPKDAEPES